jgi:hypothetical protein
LDRDGRARRGSQTPPKRPTAGLHLRAKGLLLNPTAPDKEVLISYTLAADVKARWPRLGAEVRKYLDATKKADIDAFHFAPDVHRSVPRRTGYYVGMLVARHLAKKYTFAQMCRLTGPKLRSEIEQALLELEKVDIER